MADDPETPGSSAYRAAGVDYEALDAGKRNALTEALATSELLAASGGRAVDESRGEPAFVFEAGGQTLAFVVEGLGTKSIIARQVQEQLGVSAFDNVAYDTVAAIVNDLCCVGAVPLVVNAYFATGSSDWYADEDRNGGLVRGWREACVDAGATWGGGESPSLPGLVASEDIELAGSAVGIVPPGRKPILGAELAPGDEIVIVESNGLHAERLLAGAAGGRAARRRLPDAAPEREGVRRGAARPDRDVRRARPGAARERRRGPLPQPHHRPRAAEADATAPRADVHGGGAAGGPEVLAFLVEQTEMSPAAAYSTFNMGCGFAVYCAGGSGEEVVRIASGLGLPAHVAGAVEEGPRRVVLEEIGVVFESGDMDLTPRRAA